jgi:DNA-binding MarR family transcriptional regulator
MAQLTLLEFADKLNEIFPAIFKSFAQRHTNDVYKGKITMQQFMVLDFLNSSGEAMMSEIASFMHVTTAATTGIIDRLVRHGYAIRKYDPKDRRIIKIRLNDKGIELVAKMTNQRKEMINDMFGELSNSDRQEYLRILTKIRDIIVNKGNNPS